MLVALQSWARLPVVSACPSRRLPHRRALRKCKAAAAADDAGSRREQQQAQAKVLKGVEASAATIGEMMSEITREMFLGAAVAHVTETDEPAGSAAAAVQVVVARRLEQLDSSFLATLDAYIQGASDKGATDVAEVLLLVRDEVLRSLGQRLPPEMQLLEAALAAPTSKERMDLLRRYAALSADQLPDQSVEGGSGSGSSDSGSHGAGAASLHCQAADLERAVSQVVADMELMMQIPDRTLLAKLVMVREEVQQLLVEAAFMGSMSGGNHAFSPEAGARQLPFQQLGAVSRSCAVFLQRLMALPTPKERRALLEHVLQEDRERLPSADPGPSATNFERLRAENERPQEWVRPGRLLQSLNALQQEMLHANGGGSSGESSTAGSEAPTHPAPSGQVLERLESIRREALAVLLEMAGEGQPYLP